MTAAIVPLALLLLIGGRPGEPPGENLRFPTTTLWTTQSREPPGPEIRPVPGGAGWRMMFEPGSRAAAGYVEAPIPGDRLRDLGVDAVRLEYRGRGGPQIDVMFLGSGGTYHARLPVETGDDPVEVTIPFRDFRADRDGISAGGEATMRILRIGAPREGFEVATTVDLLSVRFLATERASPARDSTRPVAAPSAPLAAPIPEVGVVARDGRLYSDGRPFFPFGVYMLGGNRSRLEEIATSGANAVVEYGPAVWPLVRVEDHLDYARCTGVRMGLALTAERHGQLYLSDSRLSPLDGHRDLLAWYLFDEPDGAKGRGLDASARSPERLQARRRSLGHAPVLVTCLNSFALQRYAETADILSIDYYLPAWGPGRSLAVSHVNAEAVVEIAASRGAVPAMLLQLAGPNWTGPSQVQTPSSLRAQVLGALAAGIRGIFLYEAVTPKRWALEGRPEGEIWNAFLELAAKVSTWGPLAARWTRVPGEPRLSPALGDVRASCFQEGDTQWIVMVNLGDQTADVVLDGECLRRALRLEDPWDGWTGTVESGRWSGQLPGREGRLVKIVASEPTPGRPSGVEGLTPPAIDGASVIRFDRAVLGITLYPTPAGAIRVYLDGEERTSASIVRRGPAAVVRSPIRALTSGMHEARLTWTEDGVPQEFAWEFRVDAAQLPIVDGFERDDLGERWGIVEDVRWIHFDPAEKPARGTVHIENGELRIASTGGSVGAVLRQVEAPEVFTMSFDVRVASAGAILIRRNEPFRRVPVSEGTHHVVFRESAHAQAVSVDGREVGRWTPNFDHRGGGIALGVPGGREAFFDDFRLEAR